MRWLVLALCLLWGAPVWAADSYKYNPFTDTLDNVGVVTGISVIGDCDTDQCFEGEDGASLTWNHSSGDATIEYDGTDFGFTAPVTVSGSDPELLGSNGIRLNFANTQYLLIGHNSGEKFYFDPKSTSNVIGVGTTTGVTHFDWGSIGGDFVSSSVVGMPAKNDCSSITADGRLCWNYNTDILYVGNGTAASVIAAAGGVEVDPTLTNDATVTVGASSGNTSIIFNGDAGTDGYVTWDVTNDVIIVPSLALSNNDTLSNGTNGTIRFAGVGGATNNTLDLKLDDASFVDLNGSLSFALQDSLNMRNGTSVVLHDSGNDRSSTIGMQNDANLRVTTTSGDVEIVENTTVSGILVGSSTITSASTTNLGWNVIDGTDNTTCESQCTTAAVFGFDLSAGATAPVIVNAQNATADLCLCAGSN